MALKQPLLIISLLLAEAGVAIIVLEEVGLSPDVLLKIDIEGAEYEVVPAIADLLRRERPFLHISFHPFNLVRGTDEYLNQIARLQAALAIAEAVAPYRHMYFHTPQGWTRIDRSDRLALLSQYLYYSWAGALITGGLLPRNVMVNAASALPPARPSLTTARKYSVAACDTFGPVKFTVGVVVDDSDTRRGSLTSMSAPWAST